MPHAHDRALSPQQRPASPQQCPLSNQQRRASAALRLTARDRELLGFLAEHRLVLESHVQQLLGLPDKVIRGRLRTLAAAGYLTYNRLFAGQPALCQIRRRGLAAIGSELPTPRFNLAGYKHDVGVAWLWLAARNGVFGPMRQVLGERHLRSHDRAADRRAEPYAVRLGGLDHDGRERLHYPDLLLINPRGGRLALELELSAKGRARRERILSGYGADSRVDRVLYLVEQRSSGRAIGRSLEASAASMRLLDRVHIQYIGPIVSVAAEEQVRSPGRVRQRVPGAEAAR